jgi:UDP-N-acetylmuramoyl-tripeptide--D-alanyl-D-alanine ligase
MKETLKDIVIRVLTWEAKMVLRRYKPKIIAITGSVGKTSTKDAIYVALTPYVHVRRSEKSYNSEMGVPLSILGLPNGWNNPFLWAQILVQGLWMIAFPQKYPEWLVLEVGADKPGDIKSIAAWLKPDVVVLTRFPDVPVHIEFFESKEHVIEEKTSLALALKSDGLLVINGDDPLITPLAGKCGARTVGYGFKETNQVWAKHVTFNYVDDGAGHKIPRGREWRLVVPEYEYIVSMPYIIGESHISAALAASAVVYGLGFNLEKAVAALYEYRTPPGRLSLLPGINGSIIVDDTYNSSPVALKASLELLQQVQIPGRKIAVIGDMMELGKYTQEAHEEIGKMLPGMCDFVVTVGIRTKYIDEGAESVGFNMTKIRHLETADQAGDFLKSMIGSGDMILVKGSQSVRLERAVKQLLADPSRAKDWLVRQEKEWEHR